jgi:8-oxo-dGTP pyrophosphatase MutT (NUDIX family)
VKGRVESGAWRVAKADERFLFLSTLPSPLSTRPLVGYHPPMAIDQPWQVLRRRTVYDGRPWVLVHQDAVRLPDGSVIDDHHVVDVPRPSVGVVPVRDDGQILLVRHHRFITNTTGWEVPAGRVDEGEDLVSAAHRELREESGHACDRLDLLGEYYPINGFTNQTFHLYVGRGARKTGEVEDVNEVSGVAWFAPDDVGAMIRRNEIRDGLTLTALLWHFLEPSQSS